MCGIVGVIQMHGPIDEKIFLQMRDTMHHRGPDGAGIYIHPNRYLALGHRRLSIIDLSDAGAQPMPNEDQTIWIVYNGELYNYAELKKELLFRGHRFRSQSDTEVILHAFEEWGPHCLDRFNGMFAFAIYNEKNDSLFIARDRLGIKPLYYYHDSAIFAFASELKAFRLHPDIATDLDPEAIYDFLTYQYIPSPKSIYRRVRKLPPASYLVYQSHTLTLQSYWDLDYQTSAVQPSEAIQIVRAELEQSVRRHLISDVPAGVFLSGGIDSSAVSLFASRMIQSIDSFCVDFDQAEKSEAIYAQIVASHLGTRHHTMRLTKEMFDSPLYQDYISLYDEPFADASGIPLFYISRFAREFVKMALSGDGGDEIFVGYGKTYLRWFKTAKRHILADWFSSLFFPWMVRLPSFLRGQPYLQYLCGDLFFRTSYLFGATTGPRKKILLGPALQSLTKDYDDLWFFRQYWRKDLDPLHRLLYLDIKTSLPERMLVKADRATMAASLELRVPLLDHRLVQTVFNFPSEILYPQFQQKYLLRELLKGALPEAIVNRPKKGFSIPLMQWLHNARSPIRQRFQHSRGVELGWFHPGLRDIESFSERHYIHGHALWALIVLETFFEKHYTLR